MNKSLIVMLMTALVGAGCVSSQSGDTYSRDEAMRTQTFREGQLIGVKKVRIEGTKSPVGLGAGAVVGGVAGSTVGEGKGALIGAVVGAVAGGLAGAAAEEGLTREDAYELTIKLDNGENFVVVQAIGKDTFAVGDRVRVLQGGGKTRVTK
ncbi:MAG TPA: glycine zipper 2TM domain-containing protein [Rhodocyclaceae bacterium]|nr:glycine zipper 2TM domain-containing protein [Rhodocyclaceae bacterium]